MVKMALKVEMQWCVKKRGMTWTRDGREERNQQLTKVEDKVNPRPLLHHLHRSSQNRSPQITRRILQSTREARCPRSKVPSCRHQFRLVFVVGNDFRKFHLDVIALNGLTTDGREGFGGSVDSSLFNVPSR
jgi:hypothetical protein